MPESAHPRILPTPAEMIAYLSRYVHGQMRAKRDLATAIYNHYLSLAALDLPGAGPQLMAGPQHTLLIGGTGTGKSLLVKTLAAFLGVPFAFISATSLVQTGYVGTPVESVVRELYTRAGNDVRRAERGIIFIDEIDKVRQWGPSDGPDVSGEGVQIGLLTLLDGRAVPVRAPGQESSGAVIDTGRILFILAGAFVGIEDEIRARIGKEAQIGFGLSRARRTLETSDLLERVEAKDLVRFGFIPEFVGRLGTVTALKPLSVEDLRRILLDTHDSVLRRKQALWKLHGIQLDFTDEALTAIAERALAHGTGARALNRLVESCLDDVDWRSVELMEAGVERLVVTEDTVRRDAPPTQEASATRASDAVRPVTELRRRAFASALRTGGPGSPRLASVTVLPTVPHSETSSWNDDQIALQVRAVKASLHWETAAPAARKWWERFEHLNSSNMRQVLWLAEELLGRRSTIDAFFNAYVSSNTDDLVANLHFHDYMRLKQAEIQNRGQPTAT